MQRSDVVQMISNASFSSAGRPWRALTSRRSWVVAGIALAGVLTYATVIPYIMITSINASVGSTTLAATLRTRAHRPEGGSTGASTSAAAALPRRGLAVQPRGVAVAQVSPQGQLARVKVAPTWDSFWGTALESDLRSLQKLTALIDHMRYQRLTKDVEDQATAGVDLALHDALLAMTRRTHLRDAQAWVSSELKGAVFDALNALQHPSNCSAARKLVCNFNKGCGFGCELHHVVHCLAHAIALNRTMVLKTFPSNYVSHKGGWEEVIEPVSSCDQDSLDPSTQQTAVSIAENGSAGADPNAAEVFCHIIDAGASTYDPPAMPPDVAELAGLFHARPEIWWVGVLVSYLLRPSPASTSRLTAFRTSQGWASPIVGVHVRRTDKLFSEAKLHQADEYMHHVEHYCDAHLAPGWQARGIARAQAAEAAAAAATHATAAVAPVSSNSSNVTAGANVTSSSVAGGVQHAGASNATASGTAPPVRQPTSECAVYLASDDAAVAAEIKSTYKHVHIITNERALSTGGTGERYSQDGFIGVYDDIVHLAAADLLVGTFSSQVSRAAYELAQINATGKDRGPDPSFSYHSVDSMWYYGGQRLYRMCVAHDVTVRGQRIAAAGQVLACPVIHEFAADGRMRCQLDDKQVELPPDAVVRCGGRTGDAAPPSLLPLRMRRPATAAKGAAAAADAGGAVHTTATAAEVVPQ